MAVKEKARNSVDKLQFSLTLIVCETSLCFTQPFCLLVTRGRVACFFTSCSLYPFVLVVSLWLTLENSMMIWSECFCSRCMTYAGLSFWGVKQHEASKNRVDNEHRRIGNDHLPFLQAFMTWCQTTSLTSLSCLQNRVKSCIKGLLSEFLTKQGNNRKRIVSKGKVSILSLVLYIRRLDKEGHHPSCFWFTRLLLSHLPFVVVLSVECLSLSSSSSRSSRHPLTPPHLILSATRGNEFLCFLPCLKPSSSFLLWWCLLFRVSCQEFREKRECFPSKPCTCMFAILCRCVCSFSWNRHPGRLYEKTKRECLCTLYIRLFFLPRLIQSSKNLLLSPPSLSLSLFFKSFSSCLMLHWFLWDSCWSFYFSFLDCFLHPSHPLLILKWSSNPWKLYHEKENNFLFLFSCIISFFCFVSPSSLRLFLSCEFCSAY